MNTRMTVIKLQAGGLWVHSPVAPTAECLRELRRLQERHGAVKHIVCATYAVEHKVFVGSLAREFPAAEVWVAPGLWSYPLNLPVRYSLSLSLPLSLSLSLVCATYAVEHKVFVGSLAREFPAAEVWVAPGLWSYPLNMPVSVRAWKQPGGLTHTRGGGKAPASTTPPIAAVDLAASPFPSRREIAFIRRSL